MERASTIVARFPQLWGARPRLWRARYNCGADVHNYGELSTVVDVAAITMARSPQLLTLRTSLLWRACHSYEFRGHNSPALSTIVNFEDTTVARSERIVHNGGCFWEWIPLWLLKPRRQ